MAIDKKISYEMQGNVRNYLGKQKMVRAPLHWQSGPDHPKTQLAYITKPELDLILKKDFHGSLKDGPNVGPSGIMSLNDPATGRSGSEVSAAETGGSGHGMSASEAAGYRSGFVAAGGRGTKDEMKAAKKEYGSRYRGQDRRSGIGGLFRGLLSFFGGAPGKAISLLSRINPSRLRGINPTTGLPNTQEEYEEQRQARINQGRIDTILGRDAPITEMTISNLGKLGYTGTMPTVGSTAESRASQTASDKDYATGLNTFEGPYSRTHLQSLANDMNANTTGTNQDYQTALGEGWATDYTGEDTNTNTNTNYQPQNLPLYPNVGLGAAEGGRIGYERGRVVNPGGYQGMTPFMAWVKDQYGVNVKDIKDWNFYSGLANEWKRLGGSKADGGIARLL